MIKTLLVSAATFMALSTQAQTWTSPAQWTNTWSPVTEAKEMGRSRVTVAADGSVFITGTYNKEVAFGTSDLLNDDAMTSAYVAKYNKSGAEQWAQGLYGNASVSSVVTDDAGNVYVGGNLTETVQFGSADGQAKSISGKDTNMSGFVAKYDAQGNLKAVKVLSPAVTNSAVVSSGLYFGAPQAQIRQVRVAGDKLLISVSFTGHLAFDQVAWDGKYIAFDWGGYDDLHQYGIFTCDASDLGNSTSVCLLASTVDSGQTPNNVESFAFTNDGNTVYLGAVMHGKLTLTTGIQHEEFVGGQTNDGTGRMEHPFMLAKVANGEITSKLFHVDMHDKSYNTDVIHTLALDQHHLFVGGTFYNQLAFDTEKMSSGSSDMFVASVDPNTFEVNWTAISGKDEGDPTKNQELMRTMTVNNGRVFISGVSDEKSGHAVVEAFSYNISPEGAITGGDNVNYADVYDNGKGSVATVVNNDTETTTAMYQAVTDGVQGVASHKGTVERVYTLSGVDMTGIKTLPKGIYIVGNKKVVVK